VRIGIQALGSQREARDALDRFTPKDTLNTAMDTRRFPAPWHAEKIPGGYVLRAANEQALALAHVYGQPNEAEAMEAKAVTEDEARHVAVNMARACLGTLLLGWKRLDRRGLCHHATGIELSGRRRAIELPVQQFTKIELVMNGFHAGCTPAEIAQLGTTPPFEAP
jgi:hypothetical protein